MLTGYAFWGMGFALFLPVLALLHDRLVVHPLPHASMTPSLVIPLGPIGVGALALIRLAGAGTATFSGSAAAMGAGSMILASTLFGFGIWWLAATATVMARYLPRGPLPYGLGWWAFTVPMGASAWQPSPSVTLGISVPSPVLRTLHEVTKGCDMTRQNADPNANIIFGAVLDDRMGGDVKITVIATDFSSVPAFNQAPAEKVPCEPSSGAAGVAP